MGLRYTLLLFALVVCVSASAGHYSTYIEPEYPPNGEYSFSSRYSDYWSIEGAIFSCIAMTVGIYYCSAGYRFMPVSMWGVGFIFAFSLVFLSLNAYRLDIWWFNAIAATIVGLLVSWIFVCFKKSLPFVLGLMCGFVMCAQFFGAFIVLAWNPSYYMILLWTSSLLFGLLYAIASTYFSLQNNMKQKYSIIVNTSIFGGYLFVVGLDFFSQDYYASIIAKMFERQTVEIYPWYISMVFMMVWIIISVFAIGLQRMIISSRTFHYKPKQNPEEYLE